MQPVYVAIILLLLTPGFGWASDYSRIANRAARPQPSNSELGMIRLQSLVSQRQSAMQMMSNLLRAQSETSKAVARNIR